MQLLPPKERSLRSSSQEDEAPEAPLDEFEDTQILRLGRGALIRHGVMRPENGQL